MACENSFQATAALIRSIAQPQLAPTDDASVSPKSQSNGLDPKKIKLPGDASPGKAELESEIQALIARVHDLEIKAVSVDLFSLYLFSTFGHAIVLT
jgi:hypothetical protein